MCMYVCVCVIVWLFKIERDDGGGGEKSERKEGKKGDSNENEASRCYCLLLQIKWTPIKSGQPWSENAMEMDRIWSTVGRRAETKT